MTDLADAAQIENESPEDVQSQQVAQISNKIKDLEELCNMDEDPKKADL